MKIMEKFWDVLGLSDPGDEYEYIDEEEVVPRHAKQKQAQQEKNNIAEQNDLEKYRDKNKNKKRNNIIAWPKGVIRETPSEGSLSVTVIEPSSFEDAQQIAEYLKQRKPIVVNFENTEQEVSKRIIDFISGTVYALDGKMQKVSPKIFLCATNNMEVTYSSMDSFKEKNY